MIYRLAPFSRRAIKTTRVLTPLLVTLASAALGQTSAGHPHSAATLKLIAPAVSTRSGLLLEPALDLSDFTREKFIKAIATIGPQNLHGAWSAPVEPLPLHPRSQTAGLTHDEVLAYMTEAKRLFDSGHAIPVADVASMSERRTDRLLDVKRSHGLPPFLAGDPGVDSGHMILQYSQAGIVSELKRLAVPASVDSIPSSAMQEDHVSMGWAGARKLRRALDGLTRVLAGEIVSAARALDLREPLPAPATGAVRDRVREVVEGPGPDRFLAPELEAVVELVRDGSLIEAAEAVTGPLG